MMAMEIEEAAHILNRLAHLDLVEVPQEDHQEDLYGKMGSVMTLTMAMTLASQGGKDLEGVMAENQPTLSLVEKIKSWEDTIELSVMKIKCMALKIV